MRNEDIEASRKKGRNIGGAILIIVGVCLLLQRLDLNLPSWLFSWQTILIGVGIAVGAKHNFRFGGWIVMVLVGGIFLTAEIMKLPYDTARFIWPVALILVGIMLLLKKVSPGSEWPPKKKIYDGNQAYGSNMESASEEELLEAIAIFGSVNKVVMSRSFKGGEVTAICGGVMLNFMKAELQGTAVVEVTSVLGGCEIIVPSDWKVRVDINTILGGVEDKRHPELATSGTEKLLILKGTCIMGGVEIRSY